MSNQNPQPVPVQQPKQKFSDAEVKNLVKEKEKLIKSGKPVRK